MYFTLHVCITFNISISIAIRSSVVSGGERNRVYGEYVEYCYYFDFFVVWMSTFDLSPLRNCAPIRSATLGGGIDNLVNNEYVVPTMLSGWTAILLSSE